MMLPGAPRLAIAVLTKKLLCALMTTSNPLLAKRYQKAKSFYEQLKLALEHQQQPAILRRYSPLAKPYFLHQAQVAADPGGEVDWGEVLSAKLAAAAAALWQGDPPTNAADLLAAVAAEDAARGRGPRYAYLILELNYFQRIFTPPPKTQATIYHDILHISRTSHDRYLKEAVEQLGVLLLQRLRPPLRLELPVWPGQLFGRAALQARALATLQAGGSVTISGPGGMGKSTLGAALVGAWPPRATFWFTVRLGLNDRLNSLLFALGYFFHQQGASALWLQLVADEGKLEDANLALGLLRADLETVETHPLLCIDEIDLLRPVDLDRPNPHHAQLLGFIESLRPHVALLLIGQSVALETTITLPLDRLARTDLEDWLRTRQIRYTQAELTQLEAYTGGNPRLLTLCLTLHDLYSPDSGDGELRPSRLANTLVRLPHTPALAPIWDRLRLRLAPLERQLLYALAVFRTPAPEDAWQLTEPAAATVAEDADPSTTASILTVALAQLSARHLVQSDGAGGIWVLPLLREILYAELTVEARERYHLGAAHIYAARGDYTEAAYHFCQGGQPDRAVAIWFPVRQGEILRGQAGAALAVMAAISAHRLARPQQQQLALLRGELYSLLGEPAKVIDTLAQGDWAPSAVESAAALRLWGEALNLQGDAAGAQEKIAAGLGVVTQLLDLQAHLHVQQGLIHLQQRELQAAWQAATQARVAAEQLQGAIQANLGHYETARRHYEAALALAETLDDSQAVARVHYYLGIAAMQQHDLPTAFIHYQAAIVAYQQIGNRVQEIYVRSNLAAAYLTAGDYPAAITEAKQALAFCTRMNAPYWMAMNAANLAEAYFELGELEPAEQYALQVIEHEEVDSYPYALYTLGSVRRRQQRRDDALHFYHQSAKIAAQNEDRFLLAYAQRGIGQVHADQGAVALATAAFEQALALFQQLGITAEARATADLLAKLIDGV